MIMHEEHLSKKWQFMDTFNKRKSQEFLRQAQPTSRVDSEEANMNLDIKEVFGFEKFPSLVKENCRYN